MTKLPPDKDPSFLDDLAFRTRARQSPVPPPPRQMVRKAVPNYLSRGLKRSTVLHVALLLGVLVQPWVSDLFESQADRLARLRAQQAKSAIRVDMVDLPKLKVEDLNQVDPTEQAGRPAPPPPPPPAPEPVKKTKVEPEPEPPPSPTAMRDKTRPEKTEKAAAKRKKEDTTATDRLKALRDSLRVDTRRKELAQKLKGPAKEGNRPELAGNILSEGDSTSGDLATLIDAYNGKVKAHLKRNYNVPGWMNTGKFKARVLVKIAPDGRVLSQEFLKHSGNAEFDGYVERAIEASSPFPPPPEHLKRDYMEEGLEWGFPD